MTNGDAELLQQIAQLAGSINSYKRNGGSPKLGSTYGDHSSYRGRSRGGYHRSRGRGRGGFAYRGASRAVPHPYSRNTRLPEPIDKPCANFTRTGKVRTVSGDITNAGKCTQGLSCRYTHDSSRVALCLRSLSGACQDATCTLSHQPVEQNAPMCMHFAKGRCMRAPCKYAHMTAIGPDASTCNSFALSGWCDKGASCPSRHAFECPDFARTGKCLMPRCHLQHVVRAKAPAPQSTAKDITSETVDLSLLVSDLLEQPGQATVSQQEQEKNVTSGEPESNSEDGTGGGNLDDSSDEGDSDADIDLTYFDKRAQGRQDFDQNESFIEL